MLFLDQTPNRVRARQAIALGSSGYVLRSRAYEEIVWALIDLLHGLTPLDGFTSGWLQTGRGVHTKIPSVSPTLAKLTPRELEVLQLLAQGNSVNECASTLKLAVNTVENHKSRLMKKLDVHKSAQLTLLAVREGLISP
jgi:DNA-binding NarL/FixJ family response regulator